MTKQVRSITANIVYNTTDYDTDSFRVFLKSKPNGKWHNLILIISRGDTNPLENYSLTLEGVSEFIEEQGLDINSCKIYLDLMEYLGIRSDYLFKWDINDNYNNDFSKIQPIKFNSLSKHDQDIIKSYYEDRWSVLTESLLTNEEKAELVANAFTTSVYDENSAMGVQLSFKYKLLNAIRTGMGFSWPCKT